MARPLPYRPTTLVSPIYTHPDSDPWKPRTRKQKRKDKRSKQQFTKLIRREIRSKANELADKQRNDLANGIQPTWYQLYLQSARWKAFKLNVLSKRGARCEDCGDATHRVQIHHLTYIRLGAELDTDVKVLCDPCHQKRHGLHPSQKGNRTGRPSRGGAANMQNETLDGRSTTVLHSAVIGAYSKPLIAGGPPLAG